ncbi:hypothetical protein C8Q80DRAFT_1265986 [Daedaleopsis nitida]|nr:hypothetical protein C8Q80DRAFT_1265986 [Daedaleopsis nitida]
MIFGGYEIWIADSNSKRLPEYQIQVEGNGNKFTCYIPSENGKRFSIRWKDHNGPASHHTSMQTYVDGLQAGRTHCKPGTSGKRRGISQESAATYYPFQFAPLKTTDDDGALWGGGVPDQIGTIELRVVHVRPHARAAGFKPSAFSGRSSTRRSRNRSCPTDFHLGVPSDRSFVNPNPPAAYTGRLGRAEKYDKLQHLRVRSTPIDKHAGPFATFTFRYRPAELLQAQGIMPALSVKAEGNAESGPSKPKKTVKGPRRALPVPADAPQERRPLKREVSDKDTDTGGGVIELTDDEDEDRKPMVKRELRPRRTFDPDDVIDLTLD